MKKLRVINIEDNNYTLSDGNNECLLNMEFYSKNQPKVNDTIYLSEKILDTVTLYTFDELHDDENASCDDIIKVVSNNKEYYLQRQFG